MSRNATDLEPASVHAFEHRLAVIQLPPETDGCTVTAPAVLSQLRLEPGLVVHVDATRVTFIDSSALGALAQTVATVREHGGFVSMRASNAARRAIELCKMGSSLGLPALPPGSTSGHRTAPDRPVTQGPTSRDRRHSYS